MNVSRVSDTVSDTVECVVLASLKGSDTTHEMPRVWDGVRDTLRAAKAVEAPGPGTQPDYSSNGSAEELEDGLDEWRERLRGVCRGCGLRALDREGRCARCGWQRTDGPVHGSLFAVRVAVAFTHCPTTRPPRLRARGPIGHARSWAGMVPARHCPLAAVVPRRGGRAHCHDVRAWRAFAT
jgi:hypothetical protein